MLHLHGGMSMSENVLNKIGDPIILLLMMSMITKQPNIWAKGV